MVAVADPNLSKLRNHEPAVINKWKATLLEYNGLASSSTIALASISISTKSRLRFLHKLSPSLRAHNSAKKLVATPMFLENPAKV